MDNFFSGSEDLFQMSIRTIEDERKCLNDIAPYFKAKWYHDVMLNHLSEYRKIDREAFDALDTFFVSPDDFVVDVPEWMLDKAHGFIRNEQYFAYDGRYIFPVKDVRGDTMGFVAYVYNETPKYLDSRTFGYRAKYSTMFGMEKLPEYYRSDKCLFVTEGIMDMAYLRLHGHNAVSLLTSKIGKYQSEILKRFKNKCIIIADNDSVNEFHEEMAAGESFVQQAFRIVPEARVFQTVNQKDINDVIRLGGDYEKRVIDDLNAMENLLCLPTEFRQRSRVKGYAKRY